jgi:hypothetical protein
VRPQPVSRCAVVGTSVLSIVKEGTVRHLPLSAAGI